MLPGHERDWSLVQVALTDITARKKAEAYLEYLGSHDVLTKLYNRSFYVDELNRLERKGPHPVTIIMADLNGLKAANDELGHAAGDALLRRAGEVLNSVIEKPHMRRASAATSSRVLLPGIRPGARRGDDGRRSTSWSRSTTSSTRAAALACRWASRPARRASGSKRWSSAPTSRCSSQARALCERGRRHHPRDIDGGLR